jgi:ribosomal protein S27E
VTEAQIAEIVRRINPDDTEQDLLHQIVGKSLVQWKLKHLGKDDIGDKRFGFSIGTSNESDIEARADELDIALTSSAWTQINADIMRLERNACNVLRNNNIMCNPEGHGDDSLDGSAWIKSSGDPTQTAALPSAKALKMLLDARHDVISTYSGNIEKYDINDTLWEGVGDMARTLVDVTINFFGTEELNLDDWEEVYATHPEMWGTVNEAKEYLDFNSLLGPPEQRNVYVKKIEGVPIFSVKCPGCKRIHGNFRTFDEASGNAQCKYCNRDYVDMMLKANETGKYKNLLKKHDKRAT